MLRFYDPVAESYLRSHEEDVSRVDEERAGRMAAEARAGTAETLAQEAEEARETAEARAGAAEARVAELEAEFRRLRGE